jgi:hypothetical protein
MVCLAQYRLVSERFICLAQVPPVPEPFFCVSFGSLTLSCKIVHFQPNSLRVHRRLTPKKLYKYEIDSIA